MNPAWHIAFCNISFTHYAGMTYRDYYGSPANMLEAQLRARDIVERRFSVGAFAEPRVEGPASSMANLLGMPIVFPDTDELPAVDPAAAPIADVADAHMLRTGDPATHGWMARRLAAWRYFRERGHDVGVGGHEGAVITTACELTGNGFLLGVLDDPLAASRLLDVVVAANQMVASLAASLAGGPTSSGYVGDDYAGLLSPALFRRFAIPVYERLYAGRKERFFHSELLQYEHLRIAKDLLDITDFHAAAAEKLTFEQMHAVMGHDFWVQLAPHEMHDLTPARIRERVRVLADARARVVQLYPGRGTPDANMAAAIEAADAFCTGGRHGGPGA